MARRFGLIATVLVLLGGAAVALYAAIRPDTPPTVETVARSPAPSSPSAPAPPPFPTAVPATPRPGRVLSVEDAVRELDLIRPSRPKLAEDFTLSLTSGKSFRLAEQRGKVVLVNFWATWCPPCREEMPAMERLYRQHRDDGFVLVAVSVDANPSLVAPFVAEYKLTFPVALDAKMDVANAYGVRALPSSFVVDRQGHLVALAIGPRPWNNDAGHSLVEGLR